MWKDWQWLRATLRYLDGNFDTPDIATPTPWTNGSTRQLSHRPPCFVGTRQPDLSTGSGLRDKDGAYLDGGRSNKLNAPLLNPRGKNEKSFPTDRYYSERVEQEDGLLVRFIPRWRVGNDRGALV